MSKSKIQFREQSQDSDVIVDWLDNPETTPEEIGAWLETFTSVDVEVSQNLRLLTAEEVEYIDETVIV